MELTSTAASAPGSPSHRPFLDGRQVEGGAPFEVVCPATGELVAVVDGMTPDGVDAAVRAARTAFADERWCGQPARARAAVLHRIADALGPRAEELARVDALCTGRPVAELALQVARLPEWLRYFASLAEALDGRVAPLGGSQLNYVERLPLGVVAQVVTWNHPLLLLVKKLAPALAAGNSVVVKPSELAPVTSILLAELCAEAGLPDGVLNVVPGLGEVGAALAGHPDLDKIDFTGGTETGRAIAAAAARNVVPLTLELGGKAPLLIFDDMPLDRSVPGALFAAFVAAGQACVSGARLLVADAVHDAFVERFARRAAALRLGHPLDPATQVGSLVSTRQRQRVLDYVEIGRAEGARLVAGGGVPRLPAPLSDGAFVEPTVFADVRPDMRIAREEIFGPVVCVERFGSEEEAVALANDSDFGLGASVWTTSLGRAHRVARRLRAGVVWVNDHHRNDPASPWGGFKASGYGRENGWEALHAYTAPRSVVVNTSDETPDWFGDGDARRYG